MDFKNAVKALQIGKKEGKKFRLSTEFGKNPEEEFPFPEYPRPQMRRENWTNLNGWWEYAFTETQKMPKQRDGKILVPFSPECDASGVKRQLLPKEYLWYFRTIQIPQIPAGKRLLLQFGAVDQDADAGASVEWVEFEEIDRTDGPVVGPRLDDQPQLSRAEDVALFDFLFEQGFPGSIDHADRSIGR